MYERTIPDLEIEILTWSLLIATEAFGDQTELTGFESYGPNSSESRTLVDSESGELDDAVVYDRSSIAPGAEIKGPAIVIESATATEITRRFRANVIDGGYMILERTNASERL